MDEDDKLKIESVEVAMKRRDDVLITGGIGAGDRIVTSSIGVPIPELQLVVRDADEGQTEPMGPDEEASPSAQGANQ